MQGTSLKRLAIFSWISLTLLTACAALDAYAYWVVSKYPQFIIRWFGPSFFGMNFIKFLHYITIAISLSWLSSFLLLVRITRIKRANNLVNKNLHNSSLRTQEQENATTESSLAAAPIPDAAPSTSPASDDTPPEQK